MVKVISSIRHSLVSKLILTVGSSLFVCISVWSYFTIKFQNENMMETIISEQDRLSNTIRLGTHYAMMTNARDDIAQIITNTSKQKDIENIRIYNKAGEIKFSNREHELEQTTNIKAEACYVCHKVEPALSTLDLSERTRIFTAPDSRRHLGVMSPIYNEPACSADPCHVHPQDKKVLGLLDVVVSLQERDQKLDDFKKGITAFAVAAFLVLSTTIMILVYLFVRRPIAKLMEGTRLIARGGPFTKIDVRQDDELGQLAVAVNQMGKEISEKQAELNRQRNEYQQLFALVPCIITVQDRNYRLVKYNRLFAERFKPKPGDFCFHAYKGRTEKCELCPVEKTFADGHSHYSEETAYNKDGTATHWIVTTSPIRDADGEIVAVMEMCLDITARRQLEKKLELSEKKYHAIFNNIPNSVFVIDADTLEILDCNESVEQLYGYSREDLMNKTFLNLFREDERAQWAGKLRTSSVINRAINLTKEGRTIYVSIRLSSSGYYPNRKVLLASTNDITKRLEAEQQLIQASKMATLGEMATGVAHELNQPLSVIQTIGSYFMRKVKRKEPIDEETLASMADGINSHVDRATKIINHMREFGRKSELNREPVQVNAVLEKAFDIFSQQLKLRNIEVVWELTPDLPLIMAEPNRLEQVFINLLINARDAIEERLQRAEPGKGDKRITLKTAASEGKVVIEVRDTGTGIPKQIADRIFEPFFTTKQTGKGTGLGLSISYGIVKDYGGDIRAVSVEGAGACFVIEFPLPEPAQVAAAGR